MILVKRNSPQFKAIKRIVADHTDLPARKRAIRLYTIKPYHKLSERVLLNSLGSGSAVLYDLAYDSMQEYLLNKNKKLFYDEDEDVFYFKSNALVKWMELPFGFATKFRREATPKKNVISNIRKL